MTTSSVISYAVWFGMPRLISKRIEGALDSLWTEVRKLWQLNTQLPAPTKFEPWLRIGNNFYRLHIQEHWSPGDICGNLRYYKKIGPKDEVMAVRIDQSWYIPHQGMLAVNVQNRFSVWKDQATQWHFARNT